MGNYIYIDYSAQVPIGASVTDHDYTQDEKSVRKCRCRKGNKFAIVRIHVPI